MGQILAQQMGQSMQGGQQPPQQPQQPPAQQGAPPPDAPVTKERIQATLDNLDEQLAAGKISEETYNRLSAKWQKRLEEMG